MYGINSRKSNPTEYMEINDIKSYKTNKGKFLFFSAILFPAIAIIITIPMLREIKNSWPAMVFFYLFFFILEFFIIRYGKTEIILDKEKISIKRSNKIKQAGLSDIIELKEFLFGPGELFYELKTKDKKILGFSSVVENCDDLLKEIESRTGLKFKQRL